VAEQLVALDRNNNVVPNATGALARARNISWRTAVPGGHVDLTCEVPMDFLRSWDVKLAYKLAAHDGLQRLWVGRIEDLTPYIDLPADLADGWRQIAAFGYGLTLSQRLFSASYASGTVYANEVIRAMAASAVPLISVGSDTVQCPNLNLVPISWTNEFAQRVIDQLLKYGDNQSPPRRWLWAVWDEMGSSTPMIASDWHGGASGNTPIDPQWDGKVLGSGTVAMSGSYLRCNSPAAADAAFVVTAKPLAYGRVFRADHKMRWYATSSHLNAIIVKAAAAQPAPGAIGYPGNWGDVVIRQDYSGNVQIRYVDSGGLGRSWNGATWVLGDANAYAGARDTWYWARIASDGTNWFVQLLDSTGNTALVTTTAIAWANTYGSAESNIWLCWGDYASDYEAGRVDSERFNVYIPAHQPTGYFWPEDPDEYEVQIPLHNIRGRISMPSTLKDTANAVLASYGTTPSYTAWAEASDSQGLYDRRDKLISAGNVSSALAQKARDVGLNIGKTPSAALSQLRIIGDVRDRAGARLPLNRVHAGQHAIIPQLGIEPFLIARTEYRPATRDEEASLAIAPDGAPDTVEMLLAQAIKASGR